MELTSYVPFELYYVAPSADYTYLYVAGAKSLQTTLKAEINSRIGGNIIK